MRLIKIGGSLLDQTDFTTALGAALAILAQPTIVVHGGGQAVDELQQKLGIPIRKVDGIRITDEATLDVVVMVLSGLVNKRLVARLQAQGVDAIGLSGSDGAILRSRPLDGGSGELGHVGEVDLVRSDLLRLLLEKGLVPVLSSLSIGSDGQLYNVNADHAAGAIAAAMGAVSLDLLTEVAGVFVDGSLQSNLTPDEGLELIEAGVIHDGMIPKVETAIGALELGISQVRILDLEGLVEGGGTIFRSPSPQPVSRTQEQMNER